jgi:hypothetical protein
VKCLLAQNHRQMILESLPLDGSMLEWGSGGSTVWLLERLAPGQNLVSVEHDAAWASSVQSAVGMKHDWKLVVFDCLREAPLTNATPAEECPAELHHYICPPGVDLGSFDVFLIDGVARAACLTNVLLNAKRGATVFLHDCHRRWYDWAVTAGRRRIAEATTLPAAEGEYPPPLLRLRLR